MDTAAYLYYATNTDAVSEFYANANVYRFAVVHTLSNVHAVTDLDTDANRNHAQRRRATNATARHATCQRELPGGGLLGAVVLLGDGRAHSVAE